MEVKSPNPFVRTRSMCAGQEEDHLTEFVAVALDTCEEFRIAYGNFVLCGWVEKRDWGSLRIDSVRTQVNTAATYLIWSWEPLIESGHDN